MSIIPNMITCIRILGTFSLFFIKPLSGAFFIIYTISGLSDVFDGWAARRLGAESDLGTKLDSVADLFFYAVMLIKIFPTLFGTLPEIIWIIVGAIIAVRICSYVIAAIKYRKFASLHTYLNKLSGGALFFVPYLVKSPVGPAVCVAVCVITAFAAVEELIIHLRSKEYSEKEKTIFYHKTL